MIKVSIIGATGYTGIELIRILHQHPEAKINHYFSHSNAGKELAEIYPQFAGQGKIILEKYAPEILKDSDLVFTALPHGVSQKIVGELFEVGLKIIDLSGDFRYQDYRRYEKWYGVKHRYPELLNKAVYGLVELNRNKIKKAQLVANPGCYVTASTLGIVPAIKQKLIDLNSIIIDAKSGVSGAGRGLKRVTHFNEVDENIKAYGITTHRHTSEIEANLELFTANKEVTVSFTPHLIPVKRGILATNYFNLTQDIRKKDLYNLYQEFYKNDQFVRVLAESPEIKHITGTNYCYLGINVDRRNRRAIVLAAIDNLVKGASGQAVQNMNLMFDLPENTGLKASGIFP